MCICEKGFMNNAFYLIAVVHEEEQLGVRRSISLANEQQSVWKRNRLVERSCRQLIWLCSGPCSPALPIPSLGLSVCPHPVLRSHAPFSGIFCSPGVVVGGGESAGVRSWRHSCTTAPDAPHAWGKALYQTVEGNSCRQPARPSLAWPSPADTIWAQPKPLF